MWREMKDVMAALASCYEELVTTSREKHKALAKMDLKMLERVVKEEEKLASKIEQLEARRQAALAALAQQEADIEPTTKLRELAVRCLDRKLAAELESLHRDLERSMAEVRRVSENNTLLAEGALAAVTANLNRIGGTAAGNSYEASGKESVTRKKRLDFQA